MLTLANQSNGNAIFRNQLYFAIQGQAGRQSKAKSKATFLFSAPKDMEYHQPFSGTLDCLFFVCLK